MAITNRRFVVTQFLQQNKTPSLEMERLFRLEMSWRDRCHVLWQTGRLDEGIAETKRTLELDPLSLQNNLTLGIEFFLARQYDQAIEQEGKVLELDPNFILAYYFRGVSYVKKSQKPWGSLNKA
jgi:tetratricopeptide (TPR) repeat protein